MFQHNNPIKARSVPSVRRSRQTHVKSSVVRSATKFLFAAPSLSSSVPACDLTGFCQQRPPRRRDFPTRSQTARDDPEQLLELPMVVQVGRAVVLIDKRPSLAERIDSRFARHCRFCSEPASSGRANAEILRLPLHFFPFRNFARLGSSERTLASSVAALSDP